MHSAGKCSKSGKKPCKKCSKSKVRTGKASMPPTKKIKARKSSYA